MPRKIVQINYSFSGSRSAFDEENLPYAEPIAATPGLDWKIWIVNPTESEAGGIYLFQDEEAVRSFLEGPIIAEMKGDPSLSIKVFDVMPEHTAITRGPVR